MNRRHVILVAEDDPNIRQGLVDTLESEGYGVIPAADGREALALFRQVDCDLVLLDVMMPEVSGYDVCREIRRRNPRVPVLMLTAKGEEIDKVVGLELGADDYVTKPFGIREVLARIHAALRRATLPASEPAGGISGLPAEFQLGEATVNRKTFTVTLGGRSRPLTSREIRLLEAFAEHPGEVLSRDFLLNAVWGIEYLGTTRTLDQHVLQLRKKVEPDPARPRHLLTVHGVGYRYCPFDAGGTAGKHG